METLDTFGDRVAAINDPTSGSLQPCILFRPVSWRTKGKVFNFDFHDAQFALADSKIVRMIDSKGIFEAVTPGRTELVVKTPISQRRITLAVAGTARSPILAVPYSTVQEIAAKDSLLFIGHANLDGFDHTAVAKPGIDRLVQQAKKNGWTVVYFVSKEYPNWYTADRHPDYAIVSEGQEHQIRVDAQRVIFAGGSFMFCTLRNVQMTLHGMLKQNGARSIHFVFPAEAICVEDIWGPGDKKPYPAPMVLLTTLFARRANDTQAYDEVVVSFLDRVIMQFPVLGYPVGITGYSTDTSRALALTPPECPLTQECSCRKSGDCASTNLWAHQDSGAPQITWLLEA